MLMVVSGLSVMSFLTSLVCGQLRAEQVGAGCNNSKKVLIEVDMGGGVPCVFVSQTRSKLVVARV